MELKTVFSGTIIHAISTDFKTDPLEIHQDSLLGVSADGTVLFLEKSTQRGELEKKFGSFDGKVVDLGKRFLIPGFVDTHLHAPQYYFTGTGYDLPLLDWLTKYTFPTECRYKDTDFAKAVFTNVVTKTLVNGTTTAVYFSSIHTEASKLLVDIVRQKGQRALVGKVNMDRNSPDFYIETTANSLKETEEFVVHVTSSTNKLVTPVITPRFVPSCTPELMKGLGELAKKYDVPIQSHISENKGEVIWVKELHPEINSYSEVYDHYGLLNEKTIMAHGIYLTDKELALFKDRKAGVSHCPISNFALHSGILDVKRVLEAGVKVGLGTDVSGGYSPSILQVIRQAIVASNTLQIYDDKYKPLAFKEFFALATLGGAQLCSLDDKIGNFKPGKKFDALLVNPEKPNGTLDITPDDTIEDVLQKFLLLGDDRSFDAIYVDGVKVL